MRRSFLLVLHALFVTWALAACSDDVKPAAAPLPSPATAARAQADPTPVPGVPIARMQAGTDSVGGATALWCDGKRCRTDATAPGRPVELAGRRIILFTLGVRPERVRVQVLDRDGKERAAEALRGGTSTPAFVPEVGRGRYTVVLSASWGKQRARWLFGLRVPKSLG